MGRLPCPRIPNKCKMLHVVFATPFATTTIVKTGVEQKVTESDVKGQKK